MVETVVTVERDPKLNAGPPHQQQAFNIQPNILYFKSLPGIIKIVQILLGIICMATGSPGFYGASHFFLFVAVASFIATILWTFAYLLGIREGLNLAINWILTELLNTGLIAILYLIASIVQLAGIWVFGRYIAAGIIGLLNAVAYAAGSYFLWLEHKNGSTQ